MTKWLQFQYGDIIDRYKLEGFSVDQFIDVVCQEPFLGNFIDITEEEYEAHKTHEILHQYNKTYSLEMYRYRHASKEARNEYNQSIRRRKRNNFLESFLNEEEL